MTDQSKDDLEDRDPYWGLRIVGWGPFRLPGERKRLRKARQYAEEMAAARQHLRSREARSAADPADKLARMWASWAQEARAELDAQWPILAVTLTQLAEARGYNVEWPPAHGNPMKRRT